MFSLISPYLLDRPNDAKVESILSNALHKLVNKGGYAPKVDAQIYQTIKIQLKVIGLIDVQYLETTAGGMGLFWTLTDKGEKLMYETLSVKKE